MGLHDAAAVFGVLEDELGAVFKLAADSLTPVDVIDEIADKPGFTPEDVRKVISEKGPGAKEKGVWGRGKQILSGSRIEPLKEYRDAARGANVGIKYLKPSDDLPKEVINKMRDKAQRTIQGAGGELLRERLKTHGSRAALAAGALGAGYAALRPKQTYNPHDYDNDYPYGYPYKQAALGTSALKPGNVGRLRGMMTTNAMKAPGYAASTQANNPARNVIAAMNATKPH